MNSLEREYFDSTKRGGDVVTAVDSRDIFQGIHSARQDWLLV